MRVRPTFPCSILGSIALVGAPVEDWPQWRGPDGNNISNEAGWSVVGQPEAAWKAQIGTGYSGPVVADGRVFATGFFASEEAPTDETSGEGVDRVSCFDAETGQLLWKREYPALVYANEHAGGALSTPTVFGDTIFVPTRKGELRALAVEDGAPRWEVDLVERHQVAPQRYGFASSPLILGPNLVLNAGSTIMLDRASGETVWISDNYDANYSTVAPIRLGEDEGLVVFGGKGLVVLSAEDGAHMFTYTFRKTPRNVEGATPIVIGETVFTSSGYEQGGALVDFGGEEPVELWRTRRMRNKMAGSTLWEDHLYGFDESMLKCMDLEGNEVWRHRGLGQGALSIADGRLLLTTSDGELVIAAASPEGFLEESRAAVIDGGVFWTAPVLANGRIYVRGSLGDLVCRDHRKGDTPTGLAAAGEVDTGSDLPTPAALVAGYQAAAGFDEKPVRALRLTGRLDIHALGFANSEATWEQRSSGLWHVRIALPPVYGGFIERYFDGEIGWENNPFRGDMLLEGQKLEELRQTHGYATLFAPLGSGLPTKTVGLQTFRGIRCYRVDVEVAEEVERQVFFDARTRLLVGRTGQDESTVVFGDWREVDGVKLPFTRTVFEPESGQEERWRFDAGELEALEEDAFVLPESLR